MNSTNKTKEEKLREYFKQGFEIRLFHCLMQGDTGIHITDIKAIKPYIDPMLALGVKIGNEWVLGNSYIPELEPIPDQIPKTTLTAPIQHLGWATTFNDDSLQIAIFHGPDAPTPDQEYQANKRINEMLNPELKEDIVYVLITSNPSSIEDVFTTFEGAKNKAEELKRKFAIEHKTMGYQIAERRIIR